MNVNADEAAVLGAALYGASLSRQFLTKNIKLSDIAPYDVQVSYFAEAKITDAPGGPPRTITSTAFAKGSRTGTRKTLTFRRKNDFSLAILSPVCLLVLSTGVVAKSYVQESLRGYSVIRLPWRMGQPRLRMHLRLLSHPRQPKPRLRQKTSRSL